MSDQLDPEMQEFFAARNAKQVAIAEEKKKRDENMANAEAKAKEKEDLLHSEFPKLCETVQKFSEQYNVASGSPTDRTTVKVSTISCELTFRFAHIQAAKAKVHGHWCLKLLTPSGHDDYIYTEVGDKPWFKYVGNARTEKYTTSELAKMLFDLCEEHQNKKSKGF